MIARDRISNISITAALIIGLFVTFTVPAGAGEIVERTPVATQPAVDSAASAQHPISVAFIRDGTEIASVTNARTVADLLTEQNVRVAPEDFISPALGSPLVDGLRIEYRAAVPVQLYVDAHKRIVRTAAASVAELLAALNVRLGARDTVRPEPQSSLQPNAIVQVAHVRTWTSHVRQHIAPAVRHRPDAGMILGMTRVVDAGSAGERETVYRFDRRGARAPVRTMLASRIVRAPRAKVIVHGIATYASFARLAEQGFTSAVHFAGSALHMIATAYTAGCFGCSGVTASGAHAGFGVIAVDPSVIPLGTRLFVPGYGRAVAGDTGGSIHGNRIDLGMNDNADAMRFGRRSVTVYVLR